MHNRILMLLVTMALAAPASAAVKTRTVQYEHDGQELVGHLAWDDAIQGKRPGVLVVHEWWGLNDYARGRAEQLAKLGYVAFALDMYGKGKVTEHPKQAGEWAGQIRANVDSWRARAMAGLTVLTSYELVDDGRLAAIGYCFGGATVLEMSYAGAPLAGVVSFHGSLPVATEEGAKSVKGKILVCHGADDAFIPEEQIAKFKAALNNASADWVMIAYSGARHSFTNPGADAKGIDGIKYNKNADQRSWQHMQVFLGEIFGK